VSEITRRGATKSETYRRKESGEELAVGGVWQGVWVMTAAKSEVRLLLQV
jgi:hypothetical protein